MLALVASTEGGPAPRGQTFSAPPAHENGGTLLRPDVVPPNAESAKGFEGL